MTIKVEDKGDLVRISAIFEDVDGDIATPDTVTLKVIDPSGKEDTYTLGNGDVQQDGDSYYVDIEADEAGDWYYRWESTGTGQGAEEGQFAVKPSQFV